MLLIFYFIQNLQIFIFYKKADKLIIKNYQSITTPLKFIQNYSSIIAIALPNQHYSFYFNWKTIKFKSSCLLFGSLSRLVNFSRWQYAFSIPALYPSQIISLFPVSLNSFAVKEEVVYLSAPTISSNYLYSFFNEP